MPRKLHLRAAFVAAVHKNPKGDQCLHTSDFIRELRARNWHFTEQDANDWIEWYQAGFVDKTPDDSPNRFWIMRNMGYIR